MGDDQRCFALITYEKSGLLRYLSHLDLVRAFDRAVRRARLAVKYSEGFAPRAQISFPPPLPVGGEGTQELCAIELAEMLESRDVYRTLAPELSAFHLAQVEVRRHTSRSIWADLVAADYRVLPDFAERADGQALDRAIALFSEADQVVVERHTKRRSRTVNIRPHVYRLGLSGTMVTMCLGMTEDTMVKPAEVLAAVGKHLGICGGGWRRLVRTAMHFAVPEVRRL